MRNIVLSLDDQINSEVSFSKYFESGENNNNTIKRMKKLLAAAIQNELTDRQKDCVIQYYYEKRSVKEIAENTGIKPTTVYKHINKARKAIKKCTCYL